MTLSHTLRFGVIGNPIAHSQSPFIHTAFARQSGIALQYDRILAPLDGFTTTLQTFFNEQGCGLNVTVPFKEEAWRLASAGLSLRARMAGAVNTLWMEDDTLHGCNTDGAGLVADLERLSCHPRDKRILMLGAGGAARGAAPALLQAGCHSLHIANRTVSRADQLRSDLAIHLPKQAQCITTGTLTDIQADNWDLVINATSGSLANANPLAHTLNLSNSILAYDMVYAAQPTPFMQHAARQGATHCADGLGMLVCQAAVSFSIWHDVTPAVEPVLAALRQHMYT